jgi:hypothetical protein
MPMSGLADGVRPYQQEPTTRAFNRLRDIMTNSTIKHLIGLAAAAFTTLALFSAVAGLADKDRDAYQLAKATRATVVADASTVR